MNHPSGRILRQSRFRLFVRCPANVVVEYTRPRESMSRILKRVVGVAVLLFLVPHLAWALGQLLAGVAKTVVTPDVHKNKVYLAGFGHNRVATGVHDELYVRCLALEAGRQIVEESGMRFGSLSVGVASSQEQCSTKRRRNA